VFGCRDRAGEVATTPFTGQSGARIGVVSGQRASRVTQSRCLHVSWYLVGSTTRSAHHESGCRSGSACMTDGAGAAG
jgi:hypothetical protein